MEFPLWKRIYFTLSLKWHCLHRCYSAHSIHIAIIVPDSVISNWALGIKNSTQRIADTHIRMMNIELIFFVLGMFQNALHSFRHDLMTVLSFRIHSNWNFNSLLTSTDRMYILSSSCIQIQLHGHFYDLQLIDPPNQSWNFHTQYALALSYKMLIKKKIDIAPHVHTGCEIFSSALIIIYFFQFAKSKEKCKRIKYQRAFGVSNKHQMVSAT